MAKFAGGAIDVHAHIVADGYVDVLRGISPDHAPTVSDMEGGKRVTLPSGRSSGPLPSGMFFLADRLADMDRMQVWHQAISPPPFLFFYDLPPEIAHEYVQAGNDAMLAVAKSQPERISVLAALPLQDPERSLAELDRIGRDPHVRGVEIGSAVAETNLDDEKFEPVWREIADLDLGVVVHPVDAAGKERMTRFYLRNFVGNPLDTTLAMASIIFSGVLERHPALRLCFLHGGGFGPYQIGRWEHGWQRRPEAQVVIGRSPKEYFRQLYHDTLTHDPLSLEFLLRRVGPGRVVLGSDYMFEMGDADPVTHVLDLDLAPDVTSAILTENAERFLRFGR